MRACRASLCRASTLFRVPSSGYPGTGARRACRTGALARHISTTKLDQDIQHVVQSIHASNTQLALTITGGGIQAASWLLGVPGASRTVLDVRIPYHPHASRQELLVRDGAAEPSSLCSPGAARELAHSAYRRAAALSSIGTPVLGVACTAALATDRTRRGEDRVHVVVRGSGALVQHDLVLHRAVARDRWIQDTIAAHLILAAIVDAEGVGIDGRGAARDAGERRLAGWLGLDSGDRLASEVQVRKLDLATAVAALCSGEAECVELAAGKILLDAPRPGRVVLPGSFNPLHHGHREMMAAALAACPGKEGMFELSIGNADKGLLESAEICRRAEQFVNAGLPLVLTKAPLYAQKAQLLPGSVFVVGFDTAIRLLDTKYYGCHEDMLLKLDRLGLAGCSFLVAGRLDGPTGVYKHLGDINVPEPLRGLFRDIPESAFRADISSTELRRRAAEAPARESS